MSDLIEEADKTRSPCAQARWSLVLVSQGMDPFPRMVPPSKRCQLATQTRTFLPCDWYTSGHLSDQWMAVGVGDVDEFSVHSDEAVSTAGEGAASESSDSSCRRPSHPRLA